MRDVHSSEIPPITLSNGELDSIMDMAETSIVSAESADRLYGLSEVVETRAKASLIQAKCKMELTRRHLLSQEKEREMIEKAKRKADDDKKTSEIVTTPEPAASPAKE